MSALFGASLVEGARVKGCLHGFSLSLQVRLLPCVGSLDSPLCIHTALKNLAAALRHCCERLITPCGVPTLGSLGACDFSWLSGRSMAGFIQHNPSTLRPPSLSRLPSSLPFSPPSQLRPPINTPRRAVAIAVPIESSSFGTRTSSLPDIIQHLHILRNTSISTSSHHGSWVRPPLAARRQRHGRVARP